MVAEVPRHHLFQYHLPGMHYVKKNRSVNLLYPVPGKSRGDVHFATRHLVTGFAPRTT